MKWYLASRFKQRELIQELTKALVMKGETVVYEWARLGSLKPYNKNKDQSTVIAGEVARSFDGIDVFVLISDEAGTDMFVELGLAIGESLRSEDMRIYIVGEHNDRSLMHFHPSVIRVENLEDVFNKESIDIKL
jgi:hypothetical protein